ncbi:cytochrome b [Methylobrevis pamukkalensis]|uniref:Cytochrome b561 bacterial/Ni-hydrogenase domain-containing protein n=1 Tax=Methylobrevis pamukkalensis TaxID=1439726 RepID=A0A1E3H3U1_9HYPH|nr:cytochrome b [Methylobrevis pamukkalensis]ODN70988.1 hypothetical protein A6302_01689 [Methylobrevis pamukkalensis]
MFGSIERYAPAARILHWLVALLVLIVFPLGVVIDFVKEDVKLTFYLLHESFGFIVLWLMLARVAVRLIYPPPPHVPMPKLQQRVADTVHIGLYVALIVQPLSGFLATNAHGFPLSWFGLVDVWSPIGKSPDIAPILSVVHYVTGWTILILFCAHFGGVLYHHVIRRDETLGRML